jgi:hypothetical protein
MKTFTIENETNNITIHATRHGAEAVPDSECFTSEAGLAALAANWPGARLAEIWNSLPGETSVRKFKDRATGVARIWKAIQRLGATGGQAVGEENVAAPVAPQTPHVATKLASATTKATSTTGPPDGSKTSRVIELLNREGGVTLKELMTEMGWQAHTTRALLSAGGSLAKKHGLTVVSSKGADGDRMYSIPA